jgi:tetratricopeptide (TPR) repeat protein
MSARTRALALAIAAALGASPAARAHDGPPFPIVEERLAPPYEVSVWTDPDATDDGSAGGQFWVIVRDASGSPAPPGTRVALAVSARRGGPARAAAAEPSPRDASRFFGAVVLDHEGAWDVRVTVAGPLGSATVESEIEATYDLRPPPGMLLVYLLPFVAVGLLWLRAILGRRRYGPVPGRTSGARAVILLLAALAGGCSTCRRRLEVPEAAYREAVIAFHTGLAAMQTGLEPLAREKFDRVVALVPGEPAGWANLGLLKMRQQDLDGAGAALGEAAGLAPESAHVQRLLALLESRKGRLERSIRHWRRAVELDPDDVRARFALALETERQAGPDAVVRAQRELEALLGRRENLAARLELARLAAKGGDAAALQRAIAPLDAAKGSWPQAPRARLRDLQAVAGDPAAAATRVAFLKNVLLPVPEYRRERAALTTPLAEVGEPMTRFLVLENPQPRPAPADEGLRFEASPLAGDSAGGTSALLAMARDGDARPAVLFADGREVRLPDGPVGPFPGGPRGVAGADGLVAADLDYDYRTDLVLAGAGGVRLLRQGEDGRFADVTAKSGLSRAAAAASAFGAWAADVDTEGDLDVLLAPREGAPVVLRNNGDGTFAERQPFAGVERLRGFVWADLDGDGVPDATLLDAAGGVHVFVNLRGGAFARPALPAALPRAVALAAAETSGDWLFDVLLLGEDGTVARLGRGPDGLAWETAEVARFDPVPAGLAVGEARLLVGDLDNNAAADLVAAGPAASSFLLARPDGAYAPGAATLDLGARALADLDGDGRLEVVGVLGDGRPARARSVGAKRYHWQVLRPRSATATGDQRINSFGVGGEVELRSGLHLQKRLIEGPLVHFGLGEAPAADVVRILWPNGVLQSEFETKADAVVPASQRLKGSCPWLFAWNGREMGFVTDLIWRSPLGLRINAQGTADVLMTDDRVKVEGARLAPRDGAYELRVTAELWETHFFDLVSLLVVDHPGDTEVWVDERFAIPPPRADLIATGPVQPLRAGDDRGRDVSEVVRSRDGRHLDFAGRGAYQGLTRDHHVEVEIPEEAPRRGPLWLVATGWVHPTDSSINLAIAQGGHPKPRGLSLLAADESGRFREVRSGLGFPAGKNKTVLLDLEGVFPATGRRRARLSTNLEVFWDRLAWAVGRPDVRLVPRRLALGSADLLPRGYSVTGQADPSSPEEPRYVLAGTAPRWLDLEGYHTRHGDVRELLAAVDDRYVIMNSGDEIRLHFPAEPPPPAGRARDFVLVADGWVKDGDFNTGFSRTVLPLPTHSRAAYDVPPRRLEDDPVYRRHRRDFEVYHTRYVTPEPARAALARPGGEAER